MYQAYYLAILCPSPIRRRYRTRARWHRLLPLTESAALGWNRSLEELLVSPPKSA